MIRVEGITKHHLGRPVLEDITLEIPEGTNLGLIGPGGSGKTLLMKIICGLVTPDKGRVTIEGTDVFSLDETALATLRFRIGMLFQNYALFDFMTVAENIAFPLRQEGKLEEAEIQELVDQMLQAISLPNVGHQYSRELSGGMKKRISFARAIVRRPPIVFYDDPTAGLDPVTSSKIFLLLQEIRDRDGVTSMTVSHDIDGIKGICDNFAMLEKGRLVFWGTREEIEDAQIPLVRQFWDGFSDDALDT